MKKFNDLLETMDLNYFGTGSHKISFENMMKLFKKDQVFILDVRTLEEQVFVSLPFTTNIPLHKLSTQLDKLPKDKIIAISCSSCTRATIAFTYLLMQGYNPKILPDKIDSFVANFTPGFVKKFNLDN